jgi:hypothetical protein
VANDPLSRPSHQLPPLTGAGRDGFIVIALVAMIVIVASGAIWIGLVVLIAAGLALAAARWFLNRRL